MGTRPANSKKRIPEDQTREILCFFIERLSGEIGRTRLAKLAYMADLEARRYLGRPLTTFRYRVDHFGPFDSRLYTELVALEEAGKVFAEQHQTPEGKPYYRYRARTPAHSPTFTRAEHAILIHVLSSYAEKDLREFLDDVIYQTAPFLLVKARPRGTPLPMYRVNNEAKNRLGGIDLEKVLLAEEEVRAGKTVTLEEVRRELLGRASRKRA